MKTNTLANLKEGSKATIIGFSGTMDLKTKRRILELGFVKDEIITLEKKSILSKVFLYSLNGYLLCLRKSIANLVYVKIL